MNKRKLKKAKDELKLKKEILNARAEASKSLQFLVDLGSKKHRSKYIGSNKELSDNKAEVIDYFLKEITAVVLLRHVCKGKARCKPLFKKVIFDEADKLLEDIFK